jgi:hypothetical protein
MTLLSEKGGRWRDPVERRAFSNVWTVTETKFAGKSTEIRSALRRP